MVWRRLEPFPLMEWRHGQFARICGAFRFSSGKTGMLNRAPLWSVAMAAQFCREVELGDRVAPALPAVSRVTSFRSKHLGKRGIC